MKRLRGEDHTGQLGTETRIEREGQFRKGDISALFCSPTMELGIDIKDLSVVHMRNAPPDPARHRIIARWRLGLKLKGVVRTFGFRTFGLISREFARCNATLTNIKLEKRKQHERTLR